MPQWDSKTFEEKATGIARAFNAGRGDLQDLTIKTAKEQGLNEEQIRRLGRAVNVKAFEQKFASLKGKADRIVEFNPVDSEAVIKELTTSSPAAEKQAAARYPELPNQMRATRGWDLSYEKTANINVQQEILNSVPKDPPLESQLNHWRKVAEVVKQKIAGAEIRWDAAMDELQAHSKRIYWNRDEFEKDALALYGGDVLFELNALRKEAKLPAVEATYETATKLARHLFGEETEDTKLLKQAQAARVDFSKAIKALKVAEKKAEEIRRKIFQ